MPQQIEELLRSTLVLVAHPDDESIGCGVLLQRIARPTVLVCTDGAPERPLSWRRRLAQHRRLAAARRWLELRSAAAAVGVGCARVVRGIRDQSLHEHLGAAADAIAGAIRERKPAAIVTHAFEGGHPDHDACAFLGRWAGLEFSLPVWEMPLYHRSAPQAPLTFQRFLDSRADQVALSPTPAELRRKQQMLAKHRSQAAVIAEFDHAREVFRPQAPYDFEVSPNRAVAAFAVCEHIPIERVLHSLRAFRPSGRQVR